jgi:hypothetical protein
MNMKIPMTKYGFKYDPRGMQVTMNYDGRSLLGEINGVARDEISGTTVLEVRHFCGDEWPIRPQVFAVEVLERTYE